MKLKADGIRQYEDPRELWGILNPFGQLWTSRTFERPEAAWEYVAEYWPAEADRNCYQVIRVRLCVEVVNTDEYLIFAPNAPRWASRHRALFARRSALQEAGDA